MARLDDLREQQEILKQRRDNLAALLASDGWKEVDQALIGYIRARRSMLVEDLISSLDAAFNHAGIQGEQAGIERVRSMPQNLLVEIEMDLDMLTTELTEAQEDDE